MSENSGKLYAAKKDDVSLYKMKLNKIRLRISTLTFQNTL